MINYVFNRLYKANDGKHKYVAEYKNKETGKFKLIKLGADGYKDFIQYYKDDGKEIAENKKKLYIQRHKKNEDWTHSGQLTKGFWSLYILWGPYPDVDKNLEYLKKNKIINL